MGWGGVCVNDFVRLTVLAAEPGSNAGMASLQSMCPSPQGACRGWVLGLKLVPDRPPEVGASCSSAPA